MSRPVAGHRPPKNFAQQVLGQWPLAVVLFGVALGLAVVATGHWRAGCSLVGAAFTFGGVLRLLPDTRLELRRPPVVPRRTAWVTVLVEQVPEAWRPWLPAAA